MIIEFRSTILYAGKSPCDLSRIVVREDRLINSAAAVRNDGVERETKGDCDKEGKNAHRSVWDGQTDRTD